MGPCMQPAAAWGLQEGLGVCRSHLEHQQVQSAGVTDDHAGLPQQPPRLLLLIHLAASWLLRGGCHGGAFALEASAGAPLHLQSSRSATCCRLQILVHNKQFD